MTPPLDLEPNPPVHPADLPGVLAIENHARVLLRGLLEEVLNLTGSDYGFIAEVVDPECSPRRVAFRAAVGTLGGGGARRLRSVPPPTGSREVDPHSLLGRVIEKSEPMIANGPVTDALFGGIVPGNPRLSSLLGMPVPGPDGPIGLVAIADAPVGYDQALVKRLSAYSARLARYLALAQTFDRLGIAPSDAGGSESRIRAVIASMKDAVITIDREGRIIDANPATEQLFGHRIDEILGLNVRVLMPEPHRSRHDAYVRRYVETRDPNLIGIGRETDAVRKDGSTFPMHVMVTPFTVGDELLFVGVVRDISEHRRAVAQLDQTIRELETSRRSLTSVLNSLRIGSIVVDATGHVMFLSETVACLECIDPKTVVGKPWQAVLQLDERSMLLFADQLRRAPADRSRFPVTWPHAAGDVSYIEVEIKSDPHSAGREFVFLYDVTELHRLREEADKARYGPLIGMSDPMKRVYQLIESMARGEWTVLIEGETGVGKELIARAIHAASDRRDAAFIPVNCASITESLMTSQLFGHKKGAFTGAVRDQEGLFEAASGGTIFLDEIGDMPPALQAALLRVLQEKEVVRIGEAKPRKVDVRILAATNHDLAAQIQAGRFREDLFYRLRVGRIRVPPLRARMDDLKLLVRSFLGTQRAATGRAVWDLNAEAWALLMNHEWPGNVRELRSAVEYAVIHGKGSVLTAEDLPPEVRCAAIDASRREGRPLDEDQGGDDEQSRFRRALRETGGNRAAAARLLGVSRATFYRKLAHLGLDLPSQSNR